MRSGVWLWDRSAYLQLKYPPKICVYPLLTSLSMFVGWVSQKRSAVCFLKYKGSLPKCLVIPTYKLYCFHYHYVVIVTKLTLLKEWFFNLFFIYKYFHSLLFLLITIFSPSFDIYVFKLKQFLEISCICKHFA